ncbi:MAG: NAD-dependent epimerase/dehydratase family protein [Deltaproteobacteria bacterium]
MTALQGRRIAVTGAGGFLGRATLAALADAGASVAALAGPPGEAPASGLRAATVACADICDAAAMARFVAGADAVVHLAGPPSVAASFRDPVACVRVHAEGTATLLEACRIRGVRQLVYVSSAEVYGQPVRSPVPEDHPLSARSPYAAAKLCAEKLVEAYAHSYGLRAVILRPFSVYGPGAAAQSLIPELAALARAGEPISVRDPKPVRDYCFVTDVARAIAQACAFEARSLEVFNLGTMRGASAGEVAKLLSAAFGVAAPVGNLRQRDRPGASDIQELVADNRRARSLLRWEPEVTLEEGLRRIAGAR